MTAYEKRVNLPRPNALYPLSYQGKAAEPVSEDGKDLSTISDKTEAVNPVDQQQVLEQQKLAADQLAAMAQVAIELDKVTKPRSILQEADEIAGKDRSRDYGHPYENHRRIADIWNVQLGPKLKTPISPREVALMMIGLKLAREVNTQKRDNLVDCAGYVKMVDMIDEVIAQANNGV